MTYEQVTETVEAYIESQHTYFVLETLDIEKNGRLTGIKALVATALNVKPVMGRNSGRKHLSDRTGAWHEKKPLVRWQKVCWLRCQIHRIRYFAISHCNCPERAEAFKELLVKYATFKDVIVVDTAGISSMYANDGGIIVVV